MTDDERQRQMDFIVDTLARLTATTSQLAESQQREHARVTDLQQSYLILIRLAENHSERLEGVEGAVAELKRLTGGNGLSQAT
jgi:hypothetical protein